MKYLLTPLFLIIFVGFGQAQGNLQFNQAKIISNTDGPQTVPLGKVWKIEVYSAMPVQTRTRLMAVALHKLFSQHVEYPAFTFIITEGILLLTRSL